jgi:hypothetical protein
MVISIQLCILITQHGCLPLQCNIFFIQSIQFGTLFTASEENITVIYTRNKTAEFLHSLHFEAVYQKRGNEKQQKECWLMKTGHSLPLTNKTVYPIVVQLTKRPAAT